MLFLKQCAAFVAIIGATIFALSQLPGVAGFDMQVTGWGWVWYIGGMIGYFIGHSMVFDRIDKALAVKGNSERPALETFAFESTKWFCFPVGATLGSLILPSAFTFVNPWGGVLAVAVLGVGLGLERVAQNFIKTRHAAKQAANADGKQDDGSK